MNIAIDIRLLGKKRTGDEMVFFHLTRELLRIDSQNQYFLLTDTTDQGVISDIKQRLGVHDDSNAEVVSLPTMNRYTWNFFTLPLYFRKKNIDVFHTQYIIPFFVPRRTRIFTHIHDVSFRAYPELISWKDRVFLSLLIPRSIRVSFRILATSEFTKSEILKYYRVRPEKVSVIYNACGDDFSQESDISLVSAVREKYLLPEKYLLSVGTLQPRKNIPFLIRAFSLSGLSEHGYSLVIVGNRDAHHFDSEIDTALQETGLGEKIIFPGFVDAKDLPSLYRGARLFVFPSLYEGFGIPLLEALSQGIPVACSDIPPFREVAHSVGYFFDPTDIARTGEILYNASVEDTSRDEHLALRKRVLEGFSWRQSAEELLRLFIGSPKN